MKDLKILGVKILKYIIKKIFRGIGFIVLALAVAAGLGVGFMFVATGEVSVDRLKEELYSDYKDMDFNRPKKETYFSVAMKQSTPAGEEAEQSPMSAEYKTLYDAHLKRMEGSLIYLEEGDSNILDDKQTLAVLTRELTDSIKEVDAHRTRYEDEVFMVTLNGRDTLEDERVKASNDAYLTALNNLSIALEEKNKEGFEASIVELDSAGEILVNGVPE